MFGQITAKIYFEAFFLFWHLYLQNKKIVLVTGLETETVKVSVRSMIFSIELYF